MILRLSSGPGLVIRRFAFKEKSAAFGVCIVQPTKAPPLTASLQQSRNCHRPLGGSQITVLAVSAVMAVSVMMATRLKLNPPFL